MDAELSLSNYFNEAVLLEKEIIGRFKLEIRNCLGQLHNASDPAVIRVVDHHLIAEWYRSGRRHRSGGPAIVIIDRRTGVCTKEAWLKNGRLHREGEPAVILRNENNGEIWGQFLYRKGKQQSIRGIHRNDVARMFALI